MLQIGYVSTASAPQDAPTVHKILLSSRINNRRDQITGVLVAGGDRYLQVIEGPGEAVERLYEAIQADPRHRGVTTTVKHSITERCFEDWSMAYRREPGLGAYDNFLSMVMFLTHQVPDPALRYQIRTFASLLMVEDKPQRPSPWAQAS